MKNTKIKFIYLFFIFMNYYGHSQDINPIDTVKCLTDLTSKTTNSVWDEEVNENGITIYYRNISMSDIFSTREIKVELEVNSSIKHFLTFIKQDANHLNWNKAMKSLKSYEINDSTWITQFVYNVPFPLTKQDLIVQNRIELIENKALVFVYSIPNYLAKTKGIDRIKSYVGLWEIEEIEKNVLNVRYSVVTISKSMIPKFLKDPIIQKNLLKSFGILKRISKVGS